MLREAKQRRKRLYMSGVWRFRDGAPAFWAAPLMIGFWPPVPTAPLVELRPVFPRDRPTISTVLWITAVPRRLAVVAAGMPCRILQDSAPGFPERQCDGAHGDDPPPPPESQPMVCCCWRWPAGGAACWDGLARRPAVHRLHRLCWICTDYVLEMPLPPGTFGGG